MSALTRAAGALAGWKGYAAAALLGVVVAGGSAWTVRGWKADASEAKAASARDKERLAEAEAKMTAIEAAREQGRQRAVAAEDARNEAQR